ncbi:hypothetical protein [Nonomuraea candida]|uniref:hypothetical protein n=1 Tax=Nonomuraea candida TaxID=359159 RepID=UPI0006944CAD|nr:hypothetical protein [Nonomuraea candida]
MDEHVITIEWNDPPDEIGCHDHAAGTYTTFSCSCDLPLTDRDAATRHAAELGRCLVCLGSGTFAAHPRDSVRCDTCEGTGKELRPRLRPDFPLTPGLLRDLALLLPEEFGLDDVLAMLREHLPYASGAPDSLLSMAAGLVRYLEVRGVIVLCTVPDFLPAEGVEQRYDDPRWIRVP